MGAVYLAEDLAQERRVAIRSAARAFSPRPGGALFRREARLLAAVYENVVHVHTLGEPLACRMVIDCIVGPTCLRTWCRPSRVHDAIPLDLAVAWRCKLCRAVRVVHAAGIIHRDIKPSPRWRRGRRHPDGLWPGQVDPIPRGSGTHIIGTPTTWRRNRFASARAPRKKPRRCDVYALGMAWTMSSSPASCPSPAAGSPTCCKHQEEDPMPPSVFRPLICRVFDRSVLKTVARDPQLALQTLRRLMAALIAIHRKTLRRPPQRVLVAERDRWSWSAADVRQSRRADAEVVMVTDGDQVLEESAAPAAGPDHHGPRLPHLNGVEVSPRHAAADDRRCAVVVLSQRSTRGDARCASWVPGGCAKDLGLDGPDVDRPRGDQRTNAVAASSRC